MIKFGTGGYRGNIETEFNKETVKAISFALIKIINSNKLNRKVIIGYDFRFYSAEYSFYLASILASNKIQVTLSKYACPTPVVMYHTMKEDIDIGVMFTASHNPASFNGIKIFTKGGIDADVQFTELIERYANSNLLYPILEDVNISQKDLNLEYIEYLKDFIKIPKNKIRILFDCLYGTGSITIPPLLNYYQLNCHIIHNEIDHNFGGFIPNPTAENLLKNVNSSYSNYDICLGTDSDADRLGILDENGHYIDANEILAVIYHYLLNKGDKGDIVKNIATSVILDKLALKYDYKCHTVDVGFKNISSKMLETNALIGGESSGGLTIRNYLRGKDSTFSSLLFLQALAHSKLKPSQLIQKVKDEVNYQGFFKEITVNLKKTVDNSFFKKFQNISFSFLSKIQLNNNLKFIINEDTWLLIRLSGTEPLLRLVCEGKNSDEVNEYLEITKKYINSLK
ncbi:MAG: hypothetical protein LBM99_05385 [Bacillales bacterium]|jgi:phosphomannomutase|nr:hypothetical protein [Bacillales bacterium]